MATEAFSTVDIIRTKRDGGILSDEMIDWTIDAYTRGAIAEEQMSALNMAIFFQGMNRREISRWTHAMINSGERMDFSGLKDASGKILATTDKHSTGGVGDKITLPWHHLSPASGLRFRSSRAADWATPAVPWTSSKRSRAGARRYPTRKCLLSFPVPERSSARREPDWRRPIKNFTHCVM